MVEQRSCFYIGYSKKYSLGLQRSDRETSFFVTRVSRFSGHASTTTTNITTTTSYGKQNIPFPAVEFFTKHNLKRTAHNFSSFLCHVNPNELKCCSCYRTCYENCCIDVWWDNNRHQQLDQYLEEVSRKYEEDAKKRNTSCLPIYPSFSFRNQHFQIINSYRGAEGRFVYCKRDSKVPFDLPVVGTLPNLYMDEQCA